VSSVKGNGMRLMNNAFNLTVSGNTVDNTDNTIYTGGQYGIKVAAMPGYTLALRNNTVRELWPHRRRNLLL